MLEKLKEIEGSIREGKLVEAESELENIKNTNYDILKGRERIKFALLSSKILERRGRYKLGIENLNQLFSDPDYSFNNLDTSDDKLLKYFAKSKILLGRLLSFDGKLNEAKKELSKILKLSTDYNLLSSRLAAISEYGFIEFLSGNNAEAINLTSQGFSLVKFLSNPLKERYWIYHFFNLRSIIDFYQGRYHEAVVNLIRVISTGKEFDNNYLLSVAHNMLSTAYRTVGEFELALEQSEYAINYAKVVNDQFLKTKSISNKGLVLINVGEFEKGVNLLNEALAIDQQTNNFMDQPITLGNVSKALIAIGDRTKALETFQETIKLYRQANIEVEIVDKLCNYIDLLLDRGEIEEAEALLMECENYVRKHNSNMDKIKFKLRKGMYYKVKGDLENARTFFTEARTLAETIEQYKDTIRASIFLSELNLEKTLTEGLDRELIKEAFNNLDKAHFLSERTGLFPSIVKILLIRGTLYGAQLEFKKALETLDTALKIAKDREFTSFYRQTKELYERLREREKFIRPSEEKDWQSIGVNEVLTYIRLMTGRLPDLPLNIKKLDPFYVLSFIFGSTGQKKLFIDQLPQDLLAENKDYDPNHISIFFSSILGGNQYNEGLYGPLPVPNLTDFQALVYTEKLPDKKSQESPNLYWMTIIFFPKSFDPLFYNRMEIENVFSDFYQNESIKKDNYDDHHFQELKNSVKKIIQKQIKDRLKYWY